MPGGAPVGLVCRGPRRLECRPVDVREVRGVEQDPYAQGPSRGRRGGLGQDGFRRRACHSRVRAGL